MSQPLRAYQPDLDTSGASFRCDAATIRLVLDWYEGDISRKIRSASAEKERRRKWGICRDSMGSRFCNDCKPFNLLDLINAQPDVCSDWTRKSWNGTIQRPFNQAEKLGLIVKNPFRGLSFPDGDEGRDWTNEEFSAIMRGANLEFRRLLIGLRLSGLRPHEACDLEWPHIRFELGDIKIDKHKMRYRTKMPRHVPLNYPLVKLFAWIKRQKQPGRHVFQNTKGSPWTRSHADSTFRRLREKLGLPDDVKLHGCRHTFGTHAIINGVDVAIVMQLLGHGDIRTTQRYVHMAGKVDHLAGSMNQAVVSKQKPKPVVLTGTVRKPPHPTPLFDGLE